MARNNDSFDMDKYKSKEKKEKPINEKKEKESFSTFKEKDFKMKESSSFDFKVKKEKPIKEKVIKEKKEKPFKMEKDGGFNLSSLFNFGNKDNSIDFETNENENKKKMGIRIAITAVALLLVAVIAVLFLVFVLPTADNFDVSAQSIEITKLPNKTIYNVGDEANYDGIRVTVTRRNGETFIVRADECEFFGFDSSSAESDQIITVKYQGFTDTFFIDIVAPEKPDPVLKSIYLDTLPKTEYKVGEWLNTSGGIVVREYMDGSSVRINLSNADVYGWDQVWGNGPGTYTLTVKYAENGVLRETTYEITVTE